jgi:hypothetical protein
MTTRCEYWQSKVDASLALRGTRLDELPSDSEAVTAIQCLLRMRGRIEPSRFAGSTRDDVSQISPETPMDVGALYYITFIYEKSWTHADAVMIVGPHGVNSRATVREAFHAYDRWFKTVERIGIAEARARRMHPLNGTSLNWYGRQHRAP